MRKAIGYVFIFGLGIVVGFILLRNFNLFNRVSPSQARQNVLNILSQTPLPSNIGDNAIVKAAAKIEPAVVNIDTLGARPTIFGDYTDTFQGKGSGVILSPDGYIVTNNHVIDGASFIRVTTAKDQKFQGRVVGTDPEADLAVIKIEAANLPSAELGDSDGLKIGEYVIAIGNPLGVGTTVTHGIISATNRRNLPVGSGRVLKQAIQTDAPINRGNSGGALANINGQLIGINTAIASESGGNIGIGFAIPINATRSILKEIISQGRSQPLPATNPFLGIKAEPLDPSRASLYKLPPGQGVVLQVIPLTPADNAGLKTGMVVAEMDGTPVGTMEDVMSVIRNKKVGEQIHVRIVRGDSTQEDMKVTVGTRPPGVR